MSGKATAGCQMLSIIKTFDIFPLTVSASAATRVSIAAAENIFRTTLKFTKKSLDPEYSSNIVGLSRALREAQMRAMPMLNFEGHGPYLATYLSKLAVTTCDGRHRPWALPWLRPGPTTNPRGLCPLALDHAGGVRTVLVPAAAQPALPSAPIHLSCRPRALAW